jgi:hypothetical protein
LLFGKQQVYLKINYDVAMGSLAVSLDDRGIDGEWPWETVMLAILQRCCHGHSSSSGTSSDLEELQDDDGQEDSYRNQAPSSRLSEKENSCTGTESYSNPRDEADNSLDDGTLDSDYLDWDDERTLEGLLLIPKEDSPMIYERIGHFEVANGWPQILLDEWTKAKEQIITLV